jgi:hypothetical protein
MWVTKDWMLLHGYALVHQSLLVQQKLTKHVASPLTKLPPFYTDREPAEGMQGVQQKCRCCCSILCVVASRNFVQILTEAAFEIFLY